MSITPTCRDSRCASSASSCARICCGSTPFAMRSRPRGPYSTIVDACVQTAPTPARTCGTALPTNGTRVVTLAPDWPLAGSIAQRENVEYCGCPASLIATPSAVRCCPPSGCAASAKLARTMIIAWKRRVVMTPPDACILPAGPAQRSVGHDRHRRDVFDEPLPELPRPAISSAYRNARLMKVLLQRGDAGLGVVKDRC